MIGLIVALTISLTLNIVFVAVILIVLFRSKSLYSDISMINVSVGAKALQSKSVIQKTKDVYIFVDPNNGQVKYVGQSLDVKKRVRQHMREALITGPMSKWLFELYVQGQLPKVQIVVSGLSQSEANTVEQQYIKSYISKGERLFNKESFNVVPEVMNRIQIESPE